jgi:hypothetical protein
MLTESQMLKRVGLTPQRTIVPLPDTIKMLQSNASKFDKKTSEKECRDNVVLPFLSSALGFSSVQEAEFLISLEYWQDSQSRQDIVIFSPPSVLKKGMYPRFRDYTFFWNKFVKSRYSSRFIVEVKRPSKLLPHDTHIEQLTRYVSTKKDCKRKEALLTNGSIWLWWDDVVANPRQYKTFNLFQEEEMIALADKIKSVVFEDEEDYPSLKLDEYPGGFDYQKEGDYSGDWIEDSEGGYYLYPSLEEQGECIYIYLSYLDYLSYHPISRGQTIARAFGGDEVQIRGEKTSLEEVYRTWEKKYKKEKNIPREVRLPCNFFKDGLESIPVELIITKNEGGLFLRVEVFFEISTLEELGSYPAFIIRAGRGDNGFEVLQDDFGGFCCSVDYIYTGLPDSSDFVYEGDYGDDAFFCDGDLDTTSKGNIENTPENLYRIIKFELSHISESAFLDGIKVCPVSLWAYLNNRYAPFLVKGWRYSSQLNETFPLGYSGFSGVLVEEVLSQFLKEIEWSLETDYYVLGEYNYDWIEDGYNKIYYTGFTNISYSK